MAVSHDSTTICKNIVSHQYTIWNKHIKCKLEMPLLKTIGLCVLIVTDNKYIYTCCHSNIKLVCTITLCVTGTHSTCLQTHEHYNINSQKLRVQHFTIQSSRLRKLFHAVCTILWAFHYFAEI